MKQNRFSKWVWLIIGVITFVGVFYYKTNPINRIGLNISFLSTDILFWKEDWSPMGEGSVEGVFGLSKDDFKRLNRACKDTNKITFSKQITDKYLFKKSDIVCIIENSSKGGESLQLILLNRDKNYLVYRRVVMN